MRLERYFDLAIRRQLRARLVRLAGRLPVRCPRLPDPSSPDPVLVRLPHH